MSNTILLVEDDENDIFFTQRAFKKAGIINSLCVAQDGQEAKDYLGRTGKFSDRIKFPFPCLVLLDLKLPRVMGLEVLKWIRSQPELKDLVVIILSSSQMERDIDMAYQFGANAFLVKPSDPRELGEIASGIKHLWLDQSQRPVFGLRFRELAGQTL